MDERALLLAKEAAMHRPFHFLFNTFRTKDSGT